jgi:hypothetical protein
MIGCYVNLEAARRKYLLWFAKKRCNIILWRANIIFAEHFGKQLLLIEETNLSQTTPYLADPQDTSCPSAPDLAW